MDDDPTLETGLEVAKEFIPGRVRRGLYAGASILGYLLAAAVVGFAAAGVEVPTALAVALAVLGALVGPIGQLAATHTPVGDTAEYDPELDASLTDPEPED